MKHRFYCFFLGFLLFSGCQTQHLASVETNYTKIDTTLTGFDQDAEKLIASYRSQMFEEMSEIVGKTREPLSKGLPESKLGNLLADIILDKAVSETGQAVDFAIQNSGGIRIPTLYAGEINKGVIYELMPFDNEIVILNIGGMKLREFFDDVAVKSGIPISRGIKMVINNDAVESLLINGSPLDDNKVYKVAMPDFVANGGDNFVGITDNERTLTGVFIRDAILEHFKSHLARGEYVEARMEKRIVKK